MDISEQTLRLYIEQKLSAKEAKQVKEKLLSSATLMRQYLDLKEALALQKENIPIDNLLRARILKKVHEQKVPTFTYKLRFLGNNLIIEPEAEDDFLSIASFDEQQTGDLPQFRFNKSHLNSSVMVNLDYSKTENHFILALIKTGDTLNKMQVYHDNSLLQESALTTDAVRVDEPLLPGKKIVVSCLQDNKVKFSLSFSFNG